MNKLHDHTNLGFGKIQRAVGQPHHVERVIRVIKMEFFPTTMRWAEETRNERGTYDGSPRTYVTRSESLNDRMRVSIPSLCTPSKLCAVTRHFCDGGHKVRIRTTAW